MNQSQGTEACGLGESGGGGDEERRGRGGCWRSEG